MNNINLTRVELNKLIKANNLELLNQTQFNNFLISNEEILLKGEKGDLDELEKSEYQDIFDEIRSFSPVDVYDQEEGSTRIIKSICYIREKQVEWDPIEKSEDGEIMKARGGHYTDTGFNRKKGRVGQKYGTKKEPEEKQGGDKKESHEITYKNPDGSQTSTSVRIGNVTEKEAIDWLKEHTKGSDFKGSGKSDTGGKDNGGETKDDPFEVNKKKIDKMNEKLSPAGKTLFGVK